MPENTTQDLADLATLLEEKGGKVVFEGEELTVEKLRQIRDKGKNTEADYTRKTQMLADEKRKAQEMQKQLEPWFEIANYFGEHPDKADELQKLMKDEPIQKKGEDGKPDNALLEKLNALEQRLKNKEDAEVYQKQVYATQKLIASELQSLKKDYPELKEKEVLVELSTKNLDDADDETLANTIKELAKANHEARVQEKDAVLQEYLKKKGGQSTRSEGGFSAPAGQKDKPQTGRQLNNGDVRRKATEYLQSLDNE